MGPSGSGKSSLLNVLTGRALHYGPGSKTNLSESVLLARLKAGTFGVSPWDETGSYSWNPSSYSMSQRSTWSLHDPFRMGSLPKIMGSWTHFFRVMEASGMCSVQNPAKAQLEPSGCVREEG